MNDTSPTTGSGAPPSPLPPAMPAAAAALHADPVRAGSGPAAHLASLVARARGTLPLLQRRQPALFEPSTPWAGGVAATAKAPPVPAVAASPDRGEASQSGPAPSASEHRPRDEPAGEPVGRRSDAPALSGPPAVPRPSPRGSHERAGEPAGRPTHAAQSDTPAASNERGAAFDNARPATPARPPERASAVPARTPLPRPSAGEPPRLTRPTPPPGSVPLPAAPGSARPSTMPTPPSPGLARRSPPPPDATGLLGAARRRAEAPPVPTRVLQAAPRAAVSPAAAAPRPVLPSVQVSIGRIEVLATPTAPAPAPRRATATGPQLTLDAYLSGRHGGTR